MLKNSSTTRNAALPLQPVQSGEREPALDVLRGFALFGVLIAYALWNLGSKETRERLNDVKYLLVQIAANKATNKRPTTFAYSYYNQNKFLARSS